jgi:hypothetical protein
MDAMMRRLASIHRPDWARTMAADINARRSRWFRWHDSGDIQSVKHLLKIFQVCRLTPDVAHWLPTREAGLLSKIPQDRVPSNLTIRLSATKVDGPAAYKLRRARAQGTSSKRSSSDQEASARAGGPARPQAASSRTADPG